MLKSAGSCKNQHMTLYVNKFGHPHDSQILAKFGVIYNELRAAVLPNGLKTYTRD